MINSDNFFVQVPERHVDSVGYYKNALVKVINDKYPWLKVAGLDEPFYTKKGNYIRGIDYAGPKNLLTFGTAKSHDVNWVKNPEYACGKGYIPVLDLAKDWNRVMNKLDVFAKNRKPAPVQKSSYGNYYTINVNFTQSPVEVYDSFVKIGYNIIPRYITPSVIYTYQPQIVKTIQYLVTTISTI